jgi:hypothetical protein
LNLEIKKNTVPKLKGGMKSNETMHIKEEIKKRRKKKSQRNLETRRDKFGEIIAMHLVDVTPGGEPYGDGNLTFPDRQWCCRRVLSFD